MNRYMERFISILIAARWPLLVSAIVVAVAAYGPSRQLRFDRSIEHMFAPGDPLLPPYQRLKQRFGGNVVVMAVFQDERLLDPDGRGIERLAATSQRMAKVAGVRDVLSLAEVGGLLDQLQKSKRRGASQRCCPRY